jgi:hypothetical protein
MVKAATRKVRGRRAAAKPQGMSLRAFARVAGVSQPAVTKAIKSGRLSRSVARDAKGRPSIADPAAALVEWRAGATKPHAGRSGFGSRATTSGPNGNGKTLSDGPLPGTLTEAQLRVAAQREIKLKLENFQSEGHLIDAGRARRDAYNTARVVRDAILNVPDRVAAELAAETDVARVHARLDGELRAALVSLAEALDDDTVDAGGGDAPGRGGEHVVQ